MNLKTWDCIVTLPGIYGDQHADTIIGVNSCQFCFYIDPQNIPSSMDQCATVTFIIYIMFCNKLNNFNNGFSVVFDVFVLVEAVCWCDCKLCCFHNIVY